MVIAQARAREVYIKLADGSRLIVTAGPNIQSEIEYVRSLTASKPDEAWTHTDPHGHVHTYVRDDDGIKHKPTGP